jgi:Leucine-rich repeat (LRR) protein
MRYSSFIFIFLIFLLLSCTQTKTNRNNHPIQNDLETSEARLSFESIPLVDDTVIIGGFRTDYRLSVPFMTYLIEISEDECADFTGIEQLEHMESLRLYLRKTSDIDFSPLKSLPKLRNINIIGTALTKIPDLSGISSLGRLEIGYARLISLNGLEKIPQLEDLSIHDARIPVIDTSALRYLKKLKELYVHGGSYNINFDNLKDLSELEEIYFCECGEMDLTDIGQLKQVKKLHLEIRVSEETGEQSVFKNIVAIGGMTGLKELYLDEVIISVGFLANNINLEHLEIIAGEDRWNYGEPLLPLDVAPLGKLKKLKYLAIRGFELKNAHVLETLPELENLDTDLYHGH